jgi:hypothetical protein
MNSGSDFSGIQKLESSNSTNQESKVDLSLVADSSNSSTAQSKVNDTFSTTNDSKASSLAWDNSADLLEDLHENMHLDPHNISAQQAEDIDHRAQADLENLADGNDLTNEVETKDEASLEIPTVQLLTDKTAEINNNSEFAEDLSNHVLFTGPLSQEESTDHKLSSQLLTPHTGRLAPGNNTSEISAFEHSEDFTGYFTADEI